MDCKDHTTVQPERKRGQHLGPEERGAIKALKKQGFGVRAIPRAIGCAQAPLQTSWSEAHRPAGAAREKPPATLQSEGRRSIKPTERTAASPARLTPASRSSPGWSSRCGSTNGRWMPAAATPRDSACVCSLKARWSAPTPSTTWYGMACFRSRRQSCRKPWSARAGDLGTGSTKSVTAQAVQTARRSPPSVWKKAIGRAAPWWGSGPAMRRSSSPCWRKDGELPCHPHPRQDQQGRNARHGRPPG